MNISRRAHLALGYGSGDMLIPVPVNATDYKEVLVGSGYYPEDQLM